MMTLDQIKATVDAGGIVHWKNRAYQVIKDSIGQYLIAYGCGSRDENYVGLTWADGVTLNGTPEDYFRPYSDMG